MAEEKLIKKQLIKNMLLNFIAFTLIFSILGIILYTQVESSMYKSSDEELLNNRNRTGIIQKMGDDFDSRRVTMQDDIQNRNMEDLRPNKGNEIAINPRIIYIVRNSAGEEVQKDSISNNFGNISFDKNILNTIYTQKINNQYSYRCINYQVDSNGETYYIQILINVDAEESIMENFKFTLIIGIAISIAISLAASYLLSKHTLKPIIESWKKQTEFVQNASHELRTPLTIIQAKQELLLEKPETKIIDNTEDISITLSETRRLSKLVKELMELARSDSAKIKLEKRNTDIDKLITSVSEPFVEMAKANQKELKLELNYGKEINIDSNKIHELLVIVLDNSMKYTEKGDTVTIKTSEKDGKCRLEILDTGIGISDETISHMFDRFYREDKARSRETGGSGLGLSIAKSIVLEHGGTIKAKHNQPKGTIIEIKLKK